MLTISKPLSATQAQTYHAKEFTAAEQNYWKQGDTIQGEWHGKLAEEFGLSGAVGAVEFCPPRRRSASCDRRTVRAASRRP